jgi:hypothetical protein
MLLEGVEFFERSGHSLIRVGRTTGNFNFKEIRLQENEKVIGVKAIASK